MGVAEKIFCDECGGDEIFADATVWVNKNNQVADIYDGWTCNNCGNIDDFTVKQIETPSTPAEESGIFPFRLCNDNGEVIATLQPDGMKNKQAENLWMVVSYLTGSIPLKLYLTSADVVQILLAEAGNYGIWVEDE